MRLFLFVVMFFFTSEKLLAQEPVAARVAAYGQVDTDNFLFVHYDKNVYANNEIIYFTGYLIAPNITQHNVFSRIN